MALDDIREELLKGYNDIVASGIDFGNRGIITERVDTSDDFVTKNILVNTGITKDSIVAASEDSSVYEADYRNCLHKLIYKKFPDVKVILQLDSRWCSIWSGLGQNLPPVTAIHASTFGGEIPCINPNRENVEGDFFKKLDYSIVSRLACINLAEKHCIFIKHVGPLVFADSVEEAIQLHKVLEEACFRAYYISNSDSTLEYMPYQLSRYMMEGKNNAN